MRTPAKMLFVLISVMSAASVSAATLSIYDDFPGTSVNGALWPTVNGSVTVSGSNVHVSDPTNWSSLYSTAIGNGAAEQSYVFKVVDFPTTSGSQYFGVRDPNTGHYAWLRKPTGNGAGWLVLDVTGSDEPGSFTAQSNDVIELVRTATNWQVYQNGNLVLQSAGTGLLDSNDNAYFFLATSPGEDASYDYVGTMVPEPAAMAMIGWGLGVILIRRKIH